MRTSEPSRRDRGAYLFFGLAALTALAFGLFTNLRWEDYYITFRASKNLAIGHGLVFQVGQRVHTFTSPLGTLLPAFTSWITGGNSDEAAFWFFRFLSIAALGGAIALVWKCGRAWGWRPAVCALTAAFALTDAKSVSFSTNGMETGLMLLFLASCLAVFAHGPKRPALWLGAAWAALMWTRPDSFIYIGATAAGFWLFPSAQKICARRRDLLPVFLKALGVAVLLYGPWVAWAWLYYGSPIPNTVVAKTIGHHYPPVPELLEQFATLPYLLIHRHLGSAVFMPTYVGSGDWPAWNLPVCDWLAAIAMIAFLLPRMRAEGRALSLAALVGMFYVINTEIYPWYVPPVTFLSIIALGGVGESLIRLLPAGRRWTRLGLLPGAAMVAFSALLLAESAWQLKWQQEIIEGQRQDIGLWLRANRQSPHDTVFLESLGYIGYYSQLKMYDYPGMSSPEMIAARRAVGENWPALIERLKPRWVILRPVEYGAYRFKYDPWFIQHYTLATVFDSRDRVRALRHVMGIDYLKFDQTFFIYRANDPPPPQS